jgi:hypothetical protein
MVDLGSGKSPSLDSSRSPLPLAVVRTRMDHGLSAVTEMPSEVGLSLTAIKSFKKCSWTGDLEQCSQHTRRRAPKQPFTPLDALKCDYVSCKYAARVAASSFRHTQHALLVSYAERRTVDTRRYTSDVRCGVAGSGPSLQ